MTKLWLGLALCCACSASSTTDGGSPPTDASAGSGDDAAQASGGPDAGPMLPGTVSLSAATFDVTQATGTLKIAVHRVAGASGAASVDYATTDGPAALDGTEYTAQQGTLTWAANDNADKTISIPILSLVVNVRDRAFTVGISNPSGVTLGISNATVTIAADAMFVASQRVAVSQEDTCAVTPSNDVKCWGANDQNLLGKATGDDNNAHYTPELVDLGGAKAMAVAARNNSMCALLTTGQITCWGFDSSAFINGMLPASRKVVALGSGALYLLAIALLDDDSVLLANFDGTTELVPLPTGRHGRQVVGGFGAYCATLDNGELVCSNTSGGLHPEALTAVSNPGHTVRFAAQPYGPMGSANTVVPSYLRDDFMAVVSNLQGTATAQVSFGGSRSARALVSCEMYSWCALLDDASARCWDGLAMDGLGTADGQTTPVTSINLGTGRTVRALATGEIFTHMCAWLDDGSLKCWGSNSSGQLGLGDNKNRGDTANTMGDDLPAVTL